MQQIFIILTILVLAIIAWLMIYTKKIKSGFKLSPLASISFIFIITGIVFGENQALGYSLIGLGVLLTIIDIVKKLKK